MRFIYLFGIELKTVLKRGVIAVLIVCFLALLVGQALGQPVLLSYVETGSMEPTLDPGDGFIAIPVEIAGPITEGDIVVFEAESIGGGGLTTHRVVDRTNQGYLTKGDANNAVDQQSGEPPVRESRITAKALQISGHVVVIPHLGTLVTSAQTVIGTLIFYVNTELDINLNSTSIGYILFPISILLYVIDSDTNNSRDRNRDRSRETGLDMRVIIGGFALLIMLGATTAMVVPSGTQEFGIISSQVETSAVVQAGETTTRPYQLVNPGLLPSVSFLQPESGGIAVETQEVRLQPGAQSEVTVTLHAPEETGYYRYYLTEYHYLSVLPTEIIFRLYQIHPWLPILVIDGCFGIPFYLLGSTLMGSGRIRSRSRERSGSVLYQLMKRFQ
jgi:signal peptidase